MEAHLTSIHEDAGLIPGLAQRAKDLAMLWLWCRPAAVAPIRPLAWEPPYAAGTALGKKKKKKTSCWMYTILSKWFQLCKNSDTFIGDFDATVIQS